MTTTAELIAETQRLVSAGLRDEVNRLDAAIASTTTTSYAFTRPLGAIQPGSVISVDLEDHYVETSTASTPAAATVVRGFNGTTAATHLDDALVYVNQEASKGQCLLAINAELRGLAGPGLYRPRYVDITYNSSRSAYDFTGTDIIGEPGKVLARSTGSDRRWPEIKEFRFDRDMDTDDFASGMAITLYESAWSGQPLRVYYRAAFASLAALADDVAVVSFLPTYAHNVLPIGAAIRILDGRANQRTDISAQGNTRRAEEVKVGEILTGIQNLRFEKAQALAHAKEVFASSNPVRLP